jgi:hypothetical protein
LWTATIELVAWCDLKQNGSIKREKVRLEWMVSDENMELKSELLDKNQIVKLQVRVSEGSKKKMLLVEVLDANFKDDSLKEILKEELKPVFFNDNILGEFTLDKRIDLFEKVTTWMSHPCNLYFDWNEDADVMKLSLKTAHALFEKQNEWDKKLKIFAADELLELANEWLEDIDEAGETEITKETFIDAMSIESISVFPDGEFEMYFFDGDIFGGHSIYVSGNVNGKLNSADIAG